MGCKSDWVKLFVKALMNAMKARPCLWRLWAEIEAHKWRDLELNLSKTVEELRQDSQLIQANSMKKLRDNKKLLECSFAQI